ncbi:MAG: sugar phosphate isomerase/epimerase family protein [Cellvibrio sp.]
MKPYFGLRAHDYGTLPASELATKIATSGAQCIQLALSKALPDSPMLPTTLGEPGIRSVYESFTRNNINIAVLGCYIDMVTPDIAEREKSLLRFEAHLASAAQLGCRIVGTETGSPTPYLNKPDGVEAAFREALTGIRRLVTAAELVGVCVGVEPVAHYHALSSAEHAKIMLQEINSPALGIIFDPVNLVPEHGIESMDNFLDECFAAFGHKIVAIHVKDYETVDGPNGKRKSPLPAGTGSMDWTGVFKRLIKAGKHSVPILLEEAGPDQAPAAFERMQIAWGDAVKPRTQH